MKFVLYITFIFILQTPCFFADLPIHCLKSQTYGKWKFDLSTPLKASNGLRNPCGHHTPDFINSSFHSYPPLFTHNSTITLELYPNGCLEEVKRLDKIAISRKSSFVMGKIGKGMKKGGFKRACDNEDSKSWTMVYDEGFEVRFKGLKLFTFSYYYPFKGRYRSDCSKTCVGWFHNTTTKEMGCFKGKMIERDPNRNYISEQTEEINVVQGIVEKKVNQTKNITKNPNFDPEIINNNSKNPLFLERKTKTKNKNAILPHKNTILSNKKTLLITKQFTPKPTPRFKSMGKSFITEGIQLSGTFKDHLTIATRINSLEKNLWQADIDSPFKSLSLKELNQLAGGRSLTKPFYQYDFHSLDDRTTIKENVSDLPKAFSWEMFLPEPGEQGRCGSCYAISTLKMLESRLNIFEGKKLSLWEEFAVECSYYNQGCEGGYSFLLGRFAEETFLLPKEGCSFRKEQTTGICETNCNSENDIVKIKDYWYIGGSYGSCNERKIMEEIRKNGPVVLSFEPDYTFMLYKAGIYEKPGEGTWMKKGEKKPEWYKVDHSVLCYGWGEEKGEKYWLLMNSWGKKWGENGKFRMKRGVDELGIEFIGEAAIPFSVRYGEINKNEG